uniref:RING-type domain-containing protein n=1 Tax=Timema poppense TaxID=170557 RepID=A0A7R9HFM4_TIMPO|nr:unnamed protein product [Timema poppensis]
MSTCFRTCYKCKKNFVKVDGCNKMVCSCGAMMCYLCRQPIQGYCHYYIQSDRGEVFAK